MVRLLLRVLFYMKGLADCRLAIADLFGAGRKRINRRVENKNPLEIV